MTLAELFLNDPPAMNISRPPVASSKRVWGDDEAEAAGIYEGSQPQPKPKSASGLPDGFSLIEDAAPSVGGLPEGFSLIDTEDPRQKLEAGLRAGRNNDAEIYKTAAFRTNQGVPAAGMTDAAISGATAGFADEISAASRAPIDMLKRGEGFDEAYQHNLAAERDRLDQYRKANPGKAMAAEIAGGLAMPVGSAPIRTAAATGALVGAGNSEGDITQRASDAALGGATSAALGGVISGVSRVVGSKAPSAAPSVAELKGAAAKGYNSEAVKGVELAPKAISDAATTIRSRLDEEGFSDVIAARAHGILKMLEKTPDSATVTGRNLHTIQKTLGKAAGSMDPQEKKAASMALREFNEFLENVPAGSVLKGSVDDFVKTMREANANYSRAMQANNIDQKVIQAETRAAAANSGMNVSNTIRQRMADVVLNPKQNRGMHADDVAAAAQIAEGTRAGNIVRKLGNMAGGGGGMGTLVAGAIGSGAAYAGDTNPIAGLALPALGMALRGVGNRITLKQAEKLSEAIRSRAPLASATTKFEEKVAQFQAERNAKTAAAAALAARNLANNLRGSGFNVNTSDLMRVLQSPVASRAQDEQPEIPRPPGQ